MSNDSKHPWEIPISLNKRISRKLRKLAKRNATFKVGENTMEVPEDMVWTFFDNGDYYEKNVAYWIEKLLSQSKNKVFYDIGANYGYYSLKFASSASHIYAFEPVSRTNDVLLKNIGRNSLANITVYKLGLSDKKCSMEMNLYNTSGKNSLFLRHSTVDRLVGQEVIGLMPLDTLFKEERLQPPDVMKIDIEGGELYALMGAKQILEEFQPKLVIEYLEEMNKEAGYSRKDLVTELQAYGYVIHGIPEDITDLNVYSVDKFDQVQIANIIAVPENMPLFSI